MALAKNQWILVQPIPQEQASPFSGSQHGEIIVFLHLELTWVKPQEGALWICIFNLNKYNKKSLHIKRY